MHFARSRRSSPRGRSARLGTGATEWILLVSGIAMAGLAAVPWLSQRGARLWRASTATLDSGATPGEQVHATGDSSRAEPRNEDPVPPIVPTSAPAGAASDRWRQPPTGMDVYPTTRPSGSVEPVLAELRLSDLRTAAREAHQVYERLHAARHDTVIAHEFARAYLEAATSDPVWTRGSFEFEVPEDVGHDDDPEYRRRCEAGYARFRAAALERLESGSVLSRRDLVDLVNRFGADLNAGLLEYLDAVATEERYRHELDRRIAAIPEETERRRRAALEALDQTLTELEGIERGLEKGETLTLEQAQEILAWGKSVKLRIADIRDGIGAIVPVGLGLEAASNFLTQGMSAGPAALIGVLVSAYFEAGLDGIALLNETSTHIDNTAFYEFLLDCDSHAHGKPGSPLPRADAGTLRFAERHAALLRQATGVAPPAGGGAQEVEAYLQAHHDRILLKISLLETLAPEKFPRYAFGGDRYERGGYLKLLRNRELKALGDQRVALEEARRGAEDPLSWLDPDSTGR